MKYALITTYPLQGTKNIGDALITKSVGAFLKRHYPDADVVEIWRAENVEVAKKLLQDVNHVIFCCLAIRGEMTKIYTFLDHILNSTIPISIIAAGTELDMKTPYLGQANFGSSDRDLVLSAARRAQCFTTRGVLTQQFCQEIGIETSSFEGDVAFGPPNDQGAAFVPKSDVRNILVSDPHYAENYEEPFLELVSGLKKMFPDAKIQCAQHGKNPLLNSYCSTAGVERVKIYENPDTGLDIYNDCDLHVGFRVHGHVSALSRAKPSYLLEQDGRGADYGLSLEARISTPCFQIQSPVGNRLSKLTQLLLRRNSYYGAMKSAPKSLLALIEHDRKSGFRRFSEVERVIDGLRAQTDRTFKSLVKVKGAFNNV